MMNFIYSAKNISNRLLEKQIFSEIMVQNGPAGDVDQLFQSILNELFKIRDRESLF